MNAPHNPAQAHAWRRRTAAVFAAVGALIFSSGMVMITAPAANAANEVGLCHATGSDTGRDRLVPSFNAMRIYSYDPFKHRPKEQCTVGALRAEVKD